MKKFTLITFVILLIASCSKNSEKNIPFTDSIASTASTSSEESFGIDESLEIQPPENSIETKGNRPSKLEKGSKIVKDGIMRIEVDDLNIAKNYIDSLISYNNGYYEKEVLKNSDYAQSYSLKLRVPSSNFNSLVAGMEMDGGLILEKNINAKDVTEEYLDLEIRLENNRAYLKRYKQLLQKASTIKEMIQIQEKIREIEMFIDSGLGRMKYLDDRVDFSTLNIELMTKPKEYIAEAAPTFFEDILDAFKNGFSGLLYFILILANVWPIILVLIGIWIFRSKLIGRFKRKHSL